MGLAGPTEHFRLAGTPETDSLKRCPIQMHQRRKSLATAQPA